jgi:hypothetical protein
LQPSYAPTILTPPSNLSLQQVQARLITSASSPQPKTVQATGLHPATAASGTLTFSNPDNTVTLHAGDTISDNNGITFILDQDVTVRVNSSTTGAVHASTPGANGNITVDDFNAYYQVTDHATQKYLATLYIENTSAFTGGEDSYTFVQQDDIDTVTNELTSQLTAAAQATVQNQIKANEQTVGTIVCTPKTASNHRVNEKATDVTVTVSVTCQVEVFDPAAMRSMATDLLKSDTLTHLGTSYVLVGGVRTTAPQFLTGDQQNTASFSVKAEGVWVFQFNETQKQQLARAIAGKKSGGYHGVLTPTIEYSYGQHRDPRFSGECTTRFFAGDHRDGRCCARITSDLNKCSELIVFDLLRDYPIKLNWWLKHTGKACCSKPVLIRVPLPSGCQIAPGVSVCPGR